MIEIFSREQFEQALPCHCRTHERLWEHCGLIGGEHTYRVAPFAALPYRIEIRSSVGPSELCAATGEDSIRAWIVTADGKPFGSKISKYTTRVPGWQDRLTANLRKLAAMIKQIAPCESCGQPCPPFKVKRDGPNRGKLFSKCVNRDCTKPKFVWLDRGS